MSPEIQAYYENRWEMMATTGWKEFVEDTQNLFDAYNQLNAIDTHDDLMKRKGQLDILQWILSLKEVSEQSYKQLQEDEIA